MISVHGINIITVAKALRCVTLHCLQSGCHHWLLIIFAIASATAKWPMRWWSAKAAAQHCHHQKNNQTHSIGSLLLNKAKALAALARGLLAGYFPTGTAPSAGAFPNRVATNFHPTEVFSADRTWQPEVAEEICDKMGEPAGMDHFNRLLFSAPCRCIKAIKPDQKQHNPYDSISSNDHWLDAPLGADCGTHCSLSIALQRSQRATLWK